MFSGCPHVLPAVGPRVPTSAVPLQVQQLLESIDLHKVVCEVKTHRYLKKHYAQEPNQTQEMLQTPDKTQFVKYDPKNGSPMTWAPQSLLVQAPYCRMSLPHLPKGIQRPQNSHRTANLAHGSQGPPFLNDLCNDTQRISLVRSTRL